MLQMSIGLSETCHFIFDKLGKEEDEFLAGLLEPYMSEMIQLCKASAKQHILKTAGKTVNLQRLKRSLADIDLFAMCSEEMP